MMKYLNGTLVVCLGLLGALSPAPGQEAEIGSQRLAGVERLVIRWDQFHDYQAALADGQSPGTVLRELLVESMSPGLETLLTGDIESERPVRIWWLTIIVENANGGPPTLSDAQSWYGIHQDNHIPILVDAGQDVRNKYNGGQYPFFFLLRPDMAIEYWGIPEPGDNAFLALFYVDQYL